MKIKFLGKKKCQIKIKIAVSSPDDLKASLENEMLNHECKS